VLLLLSDAGDVECIPKRGHPIGIVIIPGAHLTKLERRVDSSVSAS
jgi:hypothetical protein